MCFLQACCAELELCRQNVLAVRDVKYTSGNSRVLARRSNTTANNYYSGSNSCSSNSSSNSSSNKNRNNNQNEKNHNSSNQRKLGLWSGD